VESGRKDDRPQLAAALALCRQHKARLVIAKLDRLARSVALISGLMESGGEFVAADMPEANCFMLHIMAAVAEHEREMILQRTRTALAAAKTRGGDPPWQPPAGHGESTSHHLWQCGSLPCRCSSYGSNAEKRRTKPARHCCRAERQRRKNRPWWVLACGFCSGDTAIMCPADPTGTSLINIGELAKPATVLIEKIAEAVGGLAKPWQTTRIANAEAKVALIRARARLEVSDLEERALERMLHEEARKQENIESIAHQAIPLLREDAKVENLDTDWITDFFEKSRIVSNTDMQTLWASMLASEANDPGTFSKRTVDLVSTLDKSDAELFTRFCSCAWMFGDLSPIITDIHKPFFYETIIEFGSLQHLDALGLIKIETLAGFEKQGLPKEFCVFYYGKPVALQMPKDNSSISLGHALFTKEGLQLATICGSVPSVKFYDFMISQWTNEGLSPFEPLLSNVNRSASWYNQVHTKEA